MREMSYEIGAVLSRIGKTLVVLVIVGLGFISVWGIANVLYETLKNLTADLTLANATVIALASTLATGFVLSGVGLLLKTLSRKRKGER